MVENVQIITNVRCRHHYIYSDKMENKVFCQKNIQKVLGILNMSSTEMFNIQSIHFSVLIGDTFTVL